MTQVYQYVCDGCREVVRGVVKGKLFHRDYVQFKGSQVVLQGYDFGKSESTYQYLTRPPSEDLTFCVKSGMPCVEKYLDRRRGEINFERQSRKENRLRDEATREEERRNKWLKPDPATDYGF